MPYESTCQIVLNCYIVKYIWKFRREERKGMETVKELYGEICINNEELILKGEDCRIELEYYKIKDRAQENILDMQNQFGIGIKRKLYNGNKLDIETKDILRLTNSEKVVDDVLGLLKKYKVTPITLEDVISDLRYQKYNK